MSSRAIQDQNLETAASKRLTSEEHLPALDRLVAALCVDSDRSQSDPRPARPTHLIGLLNLAARGLHPQCLKGGAANLLKMMGLRFFPEKINDSNNSTDGTDGTDATDFADYCCQFLTELEYLSPSQCSALVELMAEEIARAAALKRAKINCPEALVRAIGADCLATGWAQEYLQSNHLQNNHLQNNQGGSAKKNSLAATQFFTPNWIAAYLCQEALGDKACGTFTVLDPACGSGHLLIQALYAACAQTSASDMDARLNVLLEHCLFGLDVDAHLVKLTAFNLYLAAHDLLGHCADLPRPKVFCLESTIGSLQLIEEGAALTPWPGQQFDAIVMNPPYLSTRTMDDTTAQYLKTHFSSSSGNLYTAFMQLSMALLKEGGHLSTIVQQSFLSISRYRDFRLHLFNEYRLTSCVSLGTGSFPSRPGEKVNNAVITLQKVKAKQNDTIGFLRLQGKADHQNLITEGLKEGSLQSLKYGLARSLVQNISGQPFAFHCHEEIAAIFPVEPALFDLKEDFTLTNGLFTCDNARFVKLAAAVEERQGWVPYDKGGGKKWYHETPYLLHWGKDGEEIRAFRAERGQSRSLPGENFYFQNGLTYSYIGTSGFCARLLSEGAIFDIASSAIFSHRYDLYYLLGFLNSALVAYLLSILNPTINFQIGDLRRLPFKAPPASLELDVAQLAREAVSLVRGLPLAKACDIADLAGREKEIQEQIDRLIFEHYNLSSQAREAVLLEPWVQRGLRPIA